MPQAWRICLPSSPSFATFPNSSAESRTSAQFRRSPSKLSRRGSTIDEAETLAEEALKGRGLQPFRIDLIQKNGTLATEVLLWPDTFNNYFHPETAIAAVEVLEAAGFRVAIPQAHLCCGRPLYDHGMLTRAQALLQKILDELSPQIAAGMPIVGLEPSCVAGLPGRTPKPLSPRPASRSSLAPNLSAKRIPRNPRSSFHPAET